MLLANIFRVKLYNSSYITYVYFSYDKLMVISFYFPLILLVSIYCMRSYFLLLISICIIISMESLYLFSAHYFTLSTYTQLSLVLDILFTLSTYTKLSLILKILKFFSAFHFPHFGGMLVVYIVVYIEIYNVM